MMILFLTVSVLIFFSYFYRKLPLSLQLYWYFCWLFMLSFILTFPVKLTLIWIQMKTSRCNESIIKISSAWTRLRRNKVPSLGDSKQCHFLQSKFISFAVRYFYIPDLQKKGRTLMPCKHIWFMPKSGAAAQYGKFIVYIVFSQAENFDVKRQVLLLSWVLMLTPQEKNLPWPNLGIKAS